MNGDDLGGATRPRSLIATALTAMVAALGGAAWQRWRLRQSASEELAAAEISAEDEVSDFLAAGVRPRRRAERGVVMGSFRDESDALRAMVRVRREWPRGFEAYSPALNERFSEVMGLPESPVRLWFLGGAVFGEFSGWTVSIMLTIYYPHVVGNMPLIAVPPFTVVSFELMTLLAVVGGFCGLLLYGNMPRLEPPPEYMKRFKRDRIGIAVNCRGELEFRQAETLLRDIGAEDILRA